MTGADHFAEAERLLDSSRDLMAQEAALDTPPALALQSVSGLLERAQVHAILAQAAALVHRPAVLLDGNGAGYGHRGFKSVAT